MAKELSELFWIEGHLPPDHSRKRMFGGFSFYVDEKLILVIFESRENRIWNGCMFPAEKEHHPEILRLYPFLVNHSVLPKWLYLPADSEDFDSNAESILRELRRKNPLFGTYPKPRIEKKRGSKRAKSNRHGENETVDLSIDTRTPRMFSDEAPAEKLQKARTISDLKNLGPETEKAFLKAGIKTPKQCFDLGWKKTMEMLCKANPKNNHSILAYAVIGALQNRVWNQISEEDKTEARAFMKVLREKSKAETESTRMTTKKKSSGKKTSKLPGRKKPTKTLKKATKKARTKKPA